MLNIRVFERLLFPIHRETYKEIDKQLQMVDQKHPGMLELLKEGFSQSQEGGEDFLCWFPDLPSDFKFPSLNISVSYDPKKNLKISDLRKKSQTRINVDYNESRGKEFLGSHLVLGFFSHGVTNTFIVPISYILGVNEQKILKDESYQLYSHSIIPVEVNESNNRLLEEKLNNSLPGEAVRADPRVFQKNMFQYYGITKRTWQKRYREHAYAASRGSHLRFHRALRGDFSSIGVLEHQVERAGLTEKRALDLEEEYVDNHTHYPKHPKGLNMIPGGRPGIAFINNWAKRTGLSTENVTADNLEKVLEDLQNHTLHSNKGSSSRRYSNEKMAKKWAEDLGYRISVMTKREDRFSLEEILFARQVYAAGWSVERIAEELSQMKNTPVSVERVRKLVLGVTYSSIPDVIL